MPDRNNNNNGVSSSSSKTCWNMSLSSTTTSGLESKLQTLRRGANTLSAQVTQKLASSQSGQNLLHIGTSLSTLPPDLLLLQQELHPILNQVEQTEQELHSRLQQLQEQGVEIRLQQRKIHHAAECSELYEDLVAAERHVQPPQNKDTARAPQEEKEEFDPLDYVLGLERAALATASLVQELEASTQRVSAVVTTTTTASSGNSNSNSNSHNHNATTNSMPSIRAPLPEDTERARFLMKLSPRIRTLEKDVISALSTILQDVLQDMGSGSSSHDEEEQEELLKIGHCMRGLTLLGRGKEVESIFARVAIMPMIRSKVSMGRLDEGGGRGECAGLFGLLDDISASVAETYGSVLRQTESMFEHHGKNQSPDLVTAGVWVPLATALMADPAIQMAIFSPGIASVLQANYSALDTFLSELAGRLLQENPNDAVPQESKTTTTTTLQSLYFRPSTCPELIQGAQERIYRHAMTAEFSKKWNLPIYYQLRFGEACARLNKALDKVQEEGWEADVFTSGDNVCETLRNTLGLELPIMMELYDTLNFLWRSDVILKPLTHRFLRGAVQLVGRMVVFCRDGLENKIPFGKVIVSKDGDAMNGESSSVTSKKTYCWGENLKDVASVAWDLTVLETSMTHEYVDTVCEAVCDDDSSKDEIRMLVSQVLKEASEPIGPLVKTCWNEAVCNLLTQRCSAPLAAVKGVGATYRMTNRPPPTQPSPFVAMILRPLQEFCTEFDTRTPPQVGQGWKLSIISTVAQRYSVAVEELFATVQRTEVALKNRKSAARRTASGGMSDGDKVKLQLYLDYQQFAQNVQELGVDASSVEGVQKLKALTVEAEARRSAPTSLNKM